MEQSHAPADSLDKLEQQQDQVLADLEALERRLDSLLGEAQRMIRST